MALPIFTSTDIGDQPTPVPAQPATGRIAIVVVNRGPGNAYLSKNTTTMFLKPDEGIKFRAGERDILVMRCDSGNTASIHTAEEIAQED